MDPTNPSEAGASTESKSRTRSGNAHREHKREQKRERGDRPTWRRAAHEAATCYPLPVIDPAPLIEHDQDEAEARALAAPTAESDAERQARITWEAAGIAEAEAELNAGLYVDVTEVRAWIDSLRTDTPLPPPPTRRL